MSTQTLYGAAVLLVKDKQVYLSRRTEKVMFPKKWQFINGRLQHLEQSMGAALRLVYEQTGIKIEDKKRLHFTRTVDVESTNEFYYVYLINLNKYETPVNTCERWRGDWRLFKMESAVVLDVVPGIRGILKGLHRGLTKYELAQKVFVGPQNQSHPIDEHDRIVQQLSQGEQLHLKKLGAKMTRGCC